MSSTLTAILNFLNSPAFSLWQTIVLVYVGLLWLSIIIWVTRDSIQRSSSLSFQIFAILINIVIPVLGVILYLIIRPSHTHLERYYEEKEGAILGSGESDEKIACEKCLTSVDKNFVYCPNCAEKLKKTCGKCRQSFPNVWNICPFCGKEYKGGAPTKKKARKKSS